MRWKNTLVRVCVWVLYFPRTVIKKKDIVYVYVIILSISGFNIRVKQKRENRKGTYYPNTTVFFKIALYIHIGIWNKINRVVK